MDPLTPAPTDNTHVSVHIVPNSSFFMLIRFPATVWDECMEMDYDIFPFLKHMCKRDACFLEKDLIDGTLFSGFIDRRVIEVHGQDCLSGGQLTHTAAKLFNSQMAQSLSWYTSRTWCHHAFLSTKNGILKVVVWHLAVSFTYQVKVAMDSSLHFLEYHLLQPSKAIKDSGYDKSGSSEFGIDRLCTQ